MNNQYESMDSFIEQSMTSEEIAKEPVIEPDLLKGKR